MADSLTLDWLNENALRAYPLRELISRTSGGYTLTNGVILDAQFTYTSIPASIYLTNITVSGTTITLTVTGGLTFTASTTATYPLTVRNSDGNMIVLGLDVPNIPAGSYNFGNVTFESSVSQEFGGPWLGVQSLTFGGSSELISTINFQEGYQFGINIKGDNINFACGNSYGVPIACGHFGDLPEDCGNIVSYVNGTAPDGNNILHFVNEGGVVILEDPINYRIYIGLASNPLTDVCQPIPANPAM